MDRDCPQREKRGWMGDAGLSASSLATFFEALPFHVNFLRLIADSKPALTLEHRASGLAAP